MFLTSCVSHRMITHNAMNTGQGEHLHGTFKGQEKGMIRVSHTSHTHVTLQWSLLAFVQPGFTAERK